LEDCAFHIICFGVVVDAADVFEHVAHVAAILAEHIYVNLIEFLISFTIFLTPLCNNRNDALQVLNAIF
jgi:hypothetical protein